MANIPNKSDGNQLNAADLFKIAGYDSSGGTVSGTTSETTLATVALSASQLSQAGFCIANLKLDYNNYNIANVVSIIATFRLKRNGVTIKTVTLTTPDIDEAIATGALEFGAGMFHIDTGATFTSAVTYVITAQLNNTGPGNTAVASCDGLFVIGV